MKAVAELTLEAMRESGVDALPAFEEIFLGAFTDCPAPFGQPWYFDAFRQVAIDPEWLAGTLIANSEKEAEGAMRLWDMSRHTADAAVAAQVRVHAADEARHSRIYAAMLKTIFPSALDASETKELEQLSPRYDPGTAPPADEPLPAWATLDELVQMNIGEVRTRLNQLMLMPFARAHCDEPAQARLARMLASIVRDETRHIAYTAVLLDAAARRGQYRLVRDLMYDRLREFNTLTIAEVGTAAFEGS